MDYVYGPLEEFSFIYARANEVTRILDGIRTVADAARYARMFGKELPPQLDHLLNELERMVSDMELKIWSIRAATDGTPHG